MKNMSYKILGAFFVFLFAIVLQPNLVFAINGWTPQVDSGEISNRSQIASSADGTKIFAITGGQHITASVDSGVTWTELTNSGQRNWSSIASSSDGTKLAATAQSGYIYTSTDSGATWTEQTDSGSRSWSSIASSSDGVKLVASVGIGYIYTSTDSGATWTEQTDSGSRWWADVASSSDGVKLSALVGDGNNGYIYTSTDSGATWTQQNGSGSRGWYDLASSSDGTKLVAVVGGFNNGSIYTSTDSGVNWTQQNGAGSRKWWSVASSSDGSTLVAGENDGGHIYVSTDSGVNWTEQTDAGTGSWYSVTSSSDGAKLAALKSESYIYTYDTVTEATVTTQDATLINKTYATFNGTITDLGTGGVSERGFEYGLDTNYGSTKTESGSLYSAESFLDIVGLLECGTEYHYRAYAINPAGTVYGDDTTFTTTACADPDPASVLYAVDGYESNPDAPQLYTIDLESGTKISLSGEVGFYITGLAFHPTSGILYGATFNGTQNLITIDLETGIGTLLGEMQDPDTNPIQMDDITFRSDGTLFGWSTNEQDLYTIDVSSCNTVTCLVTKVSDSGLGTYGNGLAFDSNDNLYLFGDGDNSFYQIDPSTGLSLGNTVFSNPSGNDYVIGGASFDANDVLYASRLNYGDTPSDLITIDLDTGNITSLGNNTDMKYMDPIAFYVAAASVPVVEESSHTSSGSRAKVKINDLPVPIITPPFPPVSSECLVGDKFSSMTGQSCPLIINVPTTPNFVFLNNLSLGMIHSDVKELQKYLNTHGYQIATTGAGSPNNETTKFGALTKAGVIKFQLANKITPAVGFFGPITRGVVNGN